MFGSNGIGDKFPSKFAPDVQKNVPVKFGSMDGNRWQLSVKTRASFVANWNQDLVESSFQKLGGKILNRLLFILLYDYNLFWIFAIFLVKSQWKSVEQSRTVVFSRIIICFEFSQFFSSNRSGDQSSRAEPSCFHEFLFVFNFRNFSRQIAAKQSRKTVVFQEFLFVLNSRTFSREIA